MSDHVSTGCAPVDELLGGGFERGAATQIYGPPAAGKTNLVLSAAVETAARGAATLFVDTEGLSADRMRQVAAARAGESSPTAPDGANPLGDDGASSTGDDGSNPLAADDDDGAPLADERDSLLDGEFEGENDQGAGGAPSATDALDVRTIAERIVIAAAHDFEEQATAVQDAAELASQLDLIVLDSATGFYRLERTEQAEGEALRSVARQITHLLSLARKHDLAVAFTNQVYADPESDQTRALGGNTLNHWSGAIVRIERFRGGKRRATLEKHRARAAGETAQFRITDGGLAGGTERDAGGDHF